MSNSNSNMGFSTLTKDQGGSQSIERALLSPSSSRYAFVGLENNMASLSLNDSSTMDDLPALEPNTAAALDTFTNELQSFNTWVKNLTVDQQKTALTLILDSIRDNETIEFLHLKIKQIHNNQRDNGTNSLLSPTLTSAAVGAPPAASGSSAVPPLSPQLAESTVVPPTVRAMSPLLSTGLDTNNGSGNNLISSSTGLDSLLSSPESIHTQHYSQPAPARVLSPLLRSGGYSSLLSEAPISRPRSAGPMHQQQGGLYGMSSIEETSNTQFGFVPMHINKQTNYHLQSQNQNHRQSHHHNNSYNHSQGNTNFMNNGNSIFSEIISQPVTRVLSDGHNNDLDQRGRARFLQNKMMKNVSIGYNNSTSLPPNNRIRSNNNNGKKDSNFQQTSGSSSNNIANVMMSSSASLNNASSNNGMPKDIASDDLLLNIPSWLKALRLHKYTDNLKHLKWQEMVELNDEELDKLGVSTVGARNKLLKSFVIVKEKKGLM